MRTRVVHRQVRPADRGFTLVELMVVIGIIGLLVAIALPALNAARVAAKRAATDATINTLGTGIEQFHSDSAIGGNYPPSVRVITANPADYGSSTVQVGGATLLVWALAGADLLGPPGFRDIDGKTDMQFSNTPPGDVGGWRSDTHRGINGLYQLNVTTGKPVVSRSKSYVDMSRVKLAKQVGTTSNYQFPAATGNSTLEGNVFLDQFDQPILYYKANPNAQAYVSSGLTGMSATGGAVGGRDESRYGMVPATGRYSPLGFYDLRDNSLVTGNGQGVGIDMGAGGDHPLRYIGTATTNPLVAGPRGSFSYTLRNPSVASVFQPNREDSFILLSAGNDGLFGTADDIANFPINK